MAENCTKPRVIKHCGSWYCIKGIIAGSGNTFEAAFFDYESKVKKIKQYKMKWSSLADKLQLH